MYAHSVKLLGSRMLISAPRGSWICNRLYSKDYASSDDEQEQSKKKQSKDNSKKPDAEPAAEESAAQRLNRLLASMQTDDIYATEKTGKALPTTDFKPGQGNKKRRETAKEALASKDVFVAAKRVAALLEGEDNQNQTESELLNKLLGRQTAATDGRDKQQQPDLSHIGSGDKEQQSLSELIAGMKIDRRQKSSEPETRADFVRRALADRKQQQESERPWRQRAANKKEAVNYTGSVNLFGAEPLNIFSKATTTQPLASKDLLPTWTQLQENELKLQSTQPPTNYYEKQILWTQQGKLWRFPINNEQDLSEEEGVLEDFSEHIFLEQHLENWCPTKGPVRHFMELVCVGLSKNPYITAKEKKEHILWYRDYFESKKHVLKDLMSQERMDELTSKRAVASEKN